MRYIEVANGLVAALRAQGRFKGNCVPLKITRDGALSPYRGLNVISLNTAGQFHAVSSSVWGTAASFREAAGQLVRKGEKSLAQVVWAGWERKKPDVEERQSPPPNDEPARQVFKAWSVFSATQIDGLPLGDRPVGGGLVTHDAAHLVFLDVLKQRAANPGPGQKPLDPALAATVIQVAHAFLDMAGGKLVEVDSPALWASTSDMLAIVGTAQQCFDGLALDPGNFWAYGVPQLPEIPAVAPEPTIVVPEVTVTAAPAPVPTGNRSKSKRCTKEEDVLAFLDW